MKQPCPIPTLDELAANPGAAAGLPIAVVAALQTKCAAIIGALASAQLQHQVREEKAAREEPLLDVAEVAHRSRSRAFLCLRIGADQAASRSARRTPCARESVGGRTLHRVPRHDRAAKPTVGQAY